MEKIQFLREIDVKSRNFLFCFIGIHLISAYGRKSNDSHELDEKFRDFTWNFRPTGANQKYFHELDENFWMNDDSIAQKKSFNVPFP